MSACITSYLNEIDMKTVLLLFLYFVPGAVVETGVIMSSLLYLATACIQHRVVTQSRTRKVTINKSQFIIGCMIIGLLTFSWIALKCHINGISKRVKVMAAVSVFSTVSLGSSFAILFMYAYVLWWLKQHAVHSIMAPTWTKSVQKIITQMAVISFSWLPACCLQTYSAMAHSCPCVRVATTVFLCLHASLRLASMPVAKRCSRTAPINIYNIAYEREPRTKLNSFAIKPCPEQIKVTPVTAFSGVELDTCSDISTAIKAPTVAAQKGKNKEVSDIKQILTIKPGGLEPRISYTDKIFNYSKTQCNHRQSLSVGNMDIGRRNNTCREAWCPPSGLGKSYPW